MTSKAIYLAYRKARRQAAIDAACRIAGEVGFYTACLFVIGACTLQVAHG